MNKSGTESYFSPINLHHFHQQLKSLVVVSFKHLPMSEHQMTAFQQKKKQKQQRNGFSCIYAQILKGNHKIPKTNPKQKLKGLLPSVSFSFIPSVKFFVPEFNPF